MHTHIYTCIRTHVTSIREDTRTFIHTLHICRGGVICTAIHIDTLKYRHTYTRWCAMHCRTYVHTRAHTCVYTYALTYIHKHIHVQRWCDLHRRAYLHTLAHTHIHIYLHTYVRSSAGVT